MKTLLVLAALLVMSACADSSLLGGAMKGDWKCSVRDSNGNPFFGVGKDKKTALERANWQCLSGSPYKQSCAPDPEYCEQMK